MMNKTVELKNILNDKSYKDYVTSFLFSRPSDYSDSVIEEISKKIIEEASKKNKNKILLLDQYCGAGFFALSIYQHIKNQYDDVELILYDKIYDKNEKGQYKYLNNKEHSSFIRKIEEFYLFLSGKDKSITFGKNTKPELVSESLNIIIFDPTIRANGKKAEKAYLENLSFNSSSEVSLFGNKFFEGKDEELLQSVSDFDFFITLKGNEDLFRSLVYKLSSKKTKDAFTRVDYLRIESQNLHEQVISEQNLTKVMFFNTEKYIDLKSKLQVQGGKNKVVMFSYSPKSLKNNAEVEYKNFIYNLADDTLHRYIDKENPTDKESIMLKSDYNEYISKIFALVPQVTLDDIKLKYEELKAQL